MDDLQIKRISSFPAGMKEGAGAAPQNPVSDFKKILGQSLDEVNKLLGEADHSTAEMVAGRLDIHQAMIAMEQANVSFRLLLQVRNKMMAAYEEIMRMQI